MERWAAAKTEEGEKRDGNCSRCAQPAAREKVPGLPPGAASGQETREPLQAIDADVIPPRSLVGARHDAGLARCLSAVVQTVRAGETKKPPLRRLAMRQRSRIRPLRGGVPRCCRRIPRTGTRLVRGRRSCCDGPKCARFVLQRASGRERALLHGQRRSLASWALPQLNATASSTPTIVDSHQVPFPTSDTYSVATTMVASQSMTAPVTFTTLAAGTTA